MERTAQLTVISLSTVSLEATIVTNEMEGKGKSDFTDYNDDESSDNVAGSWNRHRVSYVKTIFWWQTYPSEKVFNIVEFARLFNAYPSTLQQLNLLLLEADLPRHIL